VDQPAATTSRELEIFATLRRSARITTDDRLHAAPVVLAGRCAVGMVEKRPQRAWAKPVPSRA